jgi:hypothetical protein
VTRRSVVALLAFLLPPVAASSAVDLARVEGTVSVPGRATAAGVEVRFLDLASGRVTAVRSDDNGAFRAPVPAGVYAIEAGRGYEISRGPRMVSAAAGQVVAASLQLAPLPAGATTGLDLQHAPKGCMAADEHPEIDATLRPATKVRQARVYFKGAREREYHYVEMIPEIGRYVACLPEPKKDAGPVDYYVEATATDGSQARSADVSSLVVGHDDTCPADRRIASVCPCRVPVAVFDVAGQPAFPSAFGGVAGQVGGSVGATTTASLITIGAAIIGVGIQLPGPGPASPSR